MNFKRILITGGSGFIGTHLVQALKEEHKEVFSLDIMPPKLMTHNSLWIKGDIKNKSDVLSAMSRFQPDTVIHLAAKASLNGKTANDFPDNTLGTTNVVECVNASDSIDRFVNTSTQYVVKPGISPESDEMLAPYTAYGESKAMAEITVRERCQKDWTTIRPTNIWGPMHPFFPKEMWRYLKRGYYLHPGFRPIRKHYGFVGNAVDQIISVAKQPEATGGKVFYITDAPIDSYEWMNAFSLALGHKKAKRIPRSLWYSMALVGSGLKRLGLKSPVDAERYFRLTVDESVPYQKTLAVTGPSRYSLADGVRLSAEWYEKAYGR